MSLSITITTEKLIQTINPLCADVYFLQKPLSQNDSETSSQFQKNEMPVQDGYSLVDV